MDKKFYITTAIDYINGKPHVGHAYEKVIADVLARRARLLGLDTRFLTGTDEHGAKIEQFAEASGLPIEQFADQTAQGFESAWKKLNLSFDRFIRTTDSDHITQVQQFVAKLRDNGFLYEGDYEGLYCVGHEAFMMEKDLVDGLCPDHQKAPVLIKEKNWFFKVSAFTETIKQKIISDELKIRPVHAKNEILAMLEEGFHDLAVTRPNVHWGIKVPWDEEQTIYVWVDALINYITGAVTTDGKNYWPADMHMIGSDIAKFHCIIWPALLLAVGMELPKAIAVHGFLTLNGKKLSKSTGNIIDPNDWVAKFGSDAVRYFMVREVPFDAHGDISEAKLLARYEGDLANGLGNLVSRVTTLVEKYTDGGLEKPNLLRASEVSDQEIAKLFDELKFHDVLALIWQEIARANKIVDETKLWELGKTDVTKFTEVASELLGIIGWCAQNLLPFMPICSQKILDAITADKISKVEPLFPKIVE